MFWLIDWLCHATWGNLVSSPKMWGESCSVVSNSLQPGQNTPGQNTGVGSHSLFHGTFPSQGSNPSFLHCRQILYQLSYQQSPLVPWPGIEPVHPALGVQSLNHWIARKVPRPSWRQEPGCILSWIPGSLTVFTCLPRKVQSNQQTEMFLDNQDSYIFFFISFFDKTIVKLFTEI